MVWFLTANSGMNVVSLLLLRTLRREKKMRKFLIHVPQGQGEENIVQEPQPPVVVNTGVSVILFHDYSV